MPKPIGTHYTRRFLFRCEQCPKCQFYSKVNSEVCIGTEYIKYGFCKYGYEDSFGELTSKSSANCCEYFESMV